MFNHEPDINLFVLFGKYIYVIKIRIFCNSIGVNYLLHPYKYILISLSKPVLDGCWHANIGLEITPFRIRDLLFEIL